MLPWVVLESRGAVVLDDDDAAGVGGSGTDAAPVGIARAEALSDGGVAAWSDRCISEAATSAPPPVRTSAAAVSSARRREVARDQRDGVDSQ